jgi:hypothetical protein
MNGYASSDRVLSGGISVGASETNKVVSQEFPITRAGSLNLVIAIKTSSTTVTNAITAKLQTGLQANWEDAKTVSITGDDWFFIKLNVEVAGDQTYLPLLPQGRLVVTTGADDAVTFDAIHVIQGQ